MKQSVVIVAGGKGLRMGGELPKQFLTLHDKPIIFHTIASFQKALPKASIILVLPKSEMARWMKLSLNTPFQKLTVVEGGETRFDSVKAGLTMVEGGIVGIHDAVRPLVNETTIKTTFEAAQKHKGAIPVIPLKDSLRKLEGEKSTAVNRGEYCLVQTPQCFYTDLLKSAYEKEFSILFTDDATVFEAAGHSLELVSGNAENIKITTPEDLKIAEFLLANT